MVWLIIITFICVLGSVYLLKMTKITKKYLLDLSTALMGGFLFVVIVRLFESGANERSFDLVRQVFSGGFNGWSFGGHNLEDFFFGFIITYLIILIYNQYKKS